MSHRLGPSDRELERLLQKGLSYQEIADRYGVKRGTIASIAHRAGISKERTQHRVTELWTPIHDRHSRKHEITMLRYREQELRGQEVPEPYDGRLRSFLDRLDEVNGVVAYAPETQEGFYVLDRDEVPPELLDPELPIVTERMTLDAIIKILLRPDPDDVAEDDRDRDVA